MTEEEKLKQFITLLVDSGLPKERVMFWLKKLDSGNLTEDDEKAFQEEIETHLQVLDKIIENTEEELAETDKKIQKSEEELLPYLQKIAEIQPEIYAADIQDFKNKLSEAEKKFMTKLENVRSSDKTKEIESIRKMLGNN
jgi:peptidoglycan hydrolase CwlO-like protein